jgi:hypothetical protein
VFNNNGSNVRGDMKAVVRAILTDSEARNIPSSPYHGKYKEYFLRYTAVLRAANVNSSTDKWTLGPQSTASAAAGNFPLSSLSVFNFFRPGYVPPQTAFADAKATVPELQITDESSTVQHMNFIQKITNEGTGDLKLSYSDFLKLADDPAKLAAKTRELMTANRLDTSRTSTLQQAIASTQDKMTRVKIALALAAAAPEHFVQK